MKTVWRLELAGSAKPKRGGARGDKRLISIARARSFVKLEEPQAPGYRSLRASSGHSRQQIAPAAFRAEGLALAVAIQMQVVRHRCSERCDDSSGIVIGVFSRCVRIALARSHLPLGGAPPEASG